MPFIHLLYRKLGSTSTGTSSRRLRIFEMRIAWVTYNHGVLFNEGKYSNDYDSMHNNTLVLVLTVTFASISSKNMVAFHTEASQKG